MKRRFRRRNRRRDGEARWRVPTRRALGRMALPGVGLLLAVVCWPLVRDRVRHHPYFAVQEVAVRGHRRLAPDAIRRMAGIEPGASIWDVDCRAAEVRLAAEPWLRAVHVRRELPSRVVIAVREERPVAILATTRGGGSPSLYYVAARGHIFAPVGTGDPRDFPYVTGLEANDLNGSEAFGPQGIHRALGLLRLAARSGPVSEVHIDRNQGLTLLPMRPTVPIEVGWGHFAEKLARLPPVMKRIAGREADIVSMSLVFQDEVLVRTRAVPQPPAPPGRRAQKI